MNYTMKLVQDESAESPRENDNFGTMVCWHSRYNLGDVQDPKETPAEFVRKHKRDLMIPLFLMDNGDLTMRTSDTEFRACDAHGWDWGLVGFIYATQEQIAKEFEGTPDPVAAAQALLECEVETYDQYSRGDVWGVVIDDEDGELVDSCWGFYGYQYAKEEGERMLAYAQEHNTVNKDQQLELSL
jgi:hypothetical protein